MPTAAVAVVSDEKPEPLTSRRFSIGGWMWAAFITAAFAFALYVFPPMADASKSVPTPEWALFFGRFHPIAVHLPVGVLFLAAIMDVLAIRRGALSEAIKPA